jgi:hypothetical protein
VAGEELTQSYFPITWSFEERQATSTSQYGFACSCPRCQVLPCVGDTVHTTAFESCHSSSTLTAHATSCTLYITQVEAAWDEDEGAASDDDADGVAAASPNGIHYSAREYKPLQPNFDNSNTQSISKWPCMPDNPASCRASDSLL